MWCEGSVMGEDARHRLHRLLLVRDPQCLFERNIV